MTFIALAPHLLAIWRNESLYRRAVWRCRCKSGACKRAPTADLPGGRWSVCPYGIMRGRHFQTCMAIWRAAQVSPISDWPTGWPAWVVGGVLAIDDAIKKIRSDAAKG